MDEQRKRRIELLIGIGAPLIINIVLAFIPGFIWFIWIAQWGYLVPAIIVLSRFKRTRIVSLLAIAGGSMTILDIAYCGYSASTGHGVL